MSDLNGSVTRTREGCPTAVSITDSTGSTVGGWRTPYIDVWADSPFIRREVYAAVADTLGRWMLTHGGGIRLADPDGDDR